MRIRVVILSLIIISIFSLLCAEEESRKVCFSNVCLSAEIARTSQDKQRGLMFRQALGEFSGMLFINQREGIYSFWMKNTLIPLDIIWINKDKVVSFVVNNAQPCAESCNPIRPESLSLYVLEVNAGFAEKYQIKSGDRVNF